MIEECAAARAGGDWRAACEAGEIDVALDRSPADLLAGFAPDLLRWHLPRALGGHTTLATDIDYVLAPDGPVEPDTVVLVVTAPASVIGSQRLRLGSARMGDLGDAVRLAPWQWDARRAGDMRAAVGGDERRVPRFRPDGTRLPAAELGIRADRPGQAERVLREAGTDEAWETAGIRLDGAFKDPYYERAVGRLRRTAIAVDPLRLAIEARRLAGQFGERSWALWYDRSRVVRVDVGDDTIRAAAVETVWWERDTPVHRLPRLHPALLRSPVDLDLVWHGLLSPSQLHPLVRSALFPAAPSRPGRASPSGCSSFPAAAAPSSSDGGASRSLPAAPASLRPSSSRDGGGNSPLAGQGSFPPSSPRDGGGSPPLVGQGSPPPFSSRDGGGRSLTVSAVRVRCHGRWHVVEHRQGRLTLPVHDDAERRRERAMRAFGGTVTGCFAVEQAWSEPVGRLPRRLRAERDDLWLRMLHGGSRVVFELLDAGMDPGLRDGRGRSLMHLLRSFDHVRLLPRLLAEGADVGALDREGNTPLATGVALGWPIGLIKALVEAGAAIGCPAYNYKELSLLEAITFQDQMHSEPRSAEALAVIDFLRRQL